MTTYKHGAFAHEPAEVNLVSFGFTTRYSDRGMRQSRVYRADLMGTVIRKTQAEITMRIEAIRDAYALDFVDSGLFDDNGNVTPHFLQNGHADNITGNRVVHRSWPKGGPGEYATGRTFRVVIEAEFAEAASQIIAGHESLYYRGTAGPRDVWQTNLTGAATKQTVETQTTQVMIQTGQMFGLRGYPDPVLIPGPLAAANEHVHLRRVNIVGPKFRGQAFTHYGWEWTYVHEFPVATPHTPNTI